MSGRSGALTQLLKAIADSRGVAQARRLERAADEVPQLESLYSQQALRDTFLNLNKAVTVMDPARFEDYAATLVPETPGSGAYFRQSAKGPIEKNVYGSLPKGIEPVGRDAYLRQLQGLIGRGGFSDVPYLSLDDPKNMKIPPATSAPLMVGSHEGRHRSRAMAGAGVPRSLVAVDMMGVPDIFQGDLLIDSFYKRYGPNPMLLPEPAWDFSTGRMLKRERPEVPLPRLFSKGGLARSGLDVLRQLADRPKPIENVTLIHAGSDFDKIDPRMFGRGEPGNLRPLGRGLYGYLARDEDEAKRAVEFSRAYLKYSPYDQTAIHAFRVPIKPGEVSFSGRVWDDNLMLPEQRQRKALWSAVRDVPAGPTRSAVFDRLGDLPKMPHMGREALRTEYLSGLDVIEAALHDVQRAERIGKWGADTPDAEIVRSIMERRGYAEGGAVEGPRTHDGYPARRNADGTHSTEVSVTVTHPRLNGGRATNIPSLWEGREVDEDDAVERALASGRSWPPFGSIDEAVAAARSRSAAGGANAPQRKARGGLAQLHEMT